MQAAIRQESPMRILLVEDEAAHAELMRGVLEPMVSDLQHVDTGAAVPMTGTGTAGDPFVADGLSIDVTGGAPAAGAARARRAR